jgi:hypothetical protein
MILAVLLSGCQRSMPEPFRIRALRPAKIDTSPLQKWELKVNGEPFGQSVHVVAEGSQVHFTGFAVPLPGTVPPYGATDFVVALRPVGEAPDEDWLARFPEDRKRDLWAPIIARGRIDNQSPMTQIHVAPGEYEARLCYRMEAEDSDLNFTVTIAKGCIRVVPATNPPTH